MAKGKKLKEGTVSAKEKKQEKIMKKLEEKKNKKRKVKI